MDRLFGGVIPGSVISLLQTIPRLTPGVITPLSAGRAEPDQGVRRGRGRPPYA
jgi:hypothetical protein